MSYGEVVLTTLHQLPGYRVVDVLGLVWGSSVRTRGALGRLVASFESIAGGRGESYLKELNKAREEAVRELAEKARSIGANAVLGIDFETTEILEGFIVVTAVGTAVRVVKED